MWTGALVPVPTAIAVEAQNLEVWGEVIADYVVVETRLALPVVPTVFGSVVVYVVYR